MNIVVLTGSPHKNGTSFLLADEFIRGAKEKEHEIYRFDCAFKKVHPCIGCDKCECGKNKCIFDDDMNELYYKLQEADVVVYVTPLYYHGFSAQIKAVIDRFHGINSSLRGSNKKAMLIVTAAYPENWVFEGIVKTFETDLRYLKWENAGTLLAYNCAIRKDIENTNYPKQAYEMGNSI